MRPNPTLLALALASACAARPRPFITASSVVTTPPARPTESPRAPRAMEWGTTTARLAPAHASAPPAPAEQRFEVDLPAGRLLRFFLHSGDFDAVLKLDGPGGFHAENDDAFPGSTDSLLEVTPTVAGRYTLTVAALTPDRHGTFTLRAEERPESGDGRGLTMGQSVVATLGGGSPDALPGQWFHFNAQPGARVRLRVTSPEFDTVATVLGPRGQVWVNDDANDLGPGRSERPVDSTIDMSVPEAGTYHLVVTSYGNRGAGGFHVTSTERPPVIVRDGEGSPAGGLAGPDGGGHIFGVYAGITNYATQNHLYGCADDARFLAEAMRAAHLQSPTEQRVLTDAQATRAALLSAIAAVAARARPDDLVIVFFSGHGGTQPAPATDTTELDGTDETIVLNDGDITDTELTAALSAIHAGTVILALDSCHAGGFADDFVSARGRIGLFSSDSDVLSDTAEPRGAGGYLSYFLRRGVLGDADGRPRDGVLQAGELTDFVYNGFVTDHTRMNPPGSNNPYQRLEMRRGSVPWAQTLWIYPRRPDLGLPPVPAIALESAGATARQ